MVYMSVLSDRPGALPTMAAKKKTGSKSTARKKTAAKAAAAKKAVSRKTSKKKASKKATARKAATAKKTPARKKTTAAKKKTSAKKKVVAKKRVKKTSARKKLAAAKPKTAARKTSKKKATAKKTTAGKAAAKKTTASKKTAAGKSTARGNVYPLKNSKSRRSATEVQPFKPYRTESGEEFMNADQIEHFRTILLDWKKLLMEEVDRTVHHMQDEAANFPDPNDRATQEEEFALELRTRDRERKLIRKIDEAILKLETGDYGYCEVCGVEIGVKRLEARPTATLCIDCKTLDEIKEKQLG